MRMIAQELVNSVQELVKPVRVHQIIVVFVQLIFTMILLLKEKESV